MLFYKQFKSFVDNDKNATINKYNSGYMKFLAVNICIVILDLVVNL